MRLNDEYPFSFRGTSITQDSSFFRAGIHGDSESKIKEAVASDSTPLDESYAKEQLDELLQKANFTYEGRKENPGGRYYFHARNDMERASWEKDLGNIVLHAYRTVWSVVLSLFLLQQSPSPMLDMPAYTDISDYKKLQVQVVQVHVLQAQAFQVQAQKLHLQAALRVSVNLQFMNFLELPTNCS